MRPGGSSALAISSRSASRLLTTADDDDGCVPGEFKNNWHQHHDASRPRRPNTATCQRQFRSHAFVKALREAKLTGSVGRVGACGDNAAMESFFALLQHVDGARKLNGFGGEK
jgi:transposase InsO family protein